MRHTSAPARSAAKTTKKLAARQSRAKGDPYFSRAVGKALEALDWLSSRTGPVTLNEATARLRLTKPSAFRLLYTLETLGYIGKTSDGRYLAVAHRPTQIPARLLGQMIRESAPVLEKLSLEFRETVSLAALFENHIEVVAVKESPQLIRMGNTLSRILPPHASSLGKVISAFQPVEVRERLLRSYGTQELTPHTISDEMALRAHFAEIQRNGYAEDWEESTPGGCCFAAPVLRPSGFAVGAVSISMPRIRLKQELQEQLIAAVRNAAAEIKQRLAD